MKQKNYLNVNTIIISKFIILFFHNFSEKSNITSHSGIIIEYIDGNTLSNIKTMNLTTKEIMKIILEIMIILEYFHHNNLIYRDLRTDNIIINSKKNCFYY